MTKEEIALVRQIATEIAQEVVAAAFVKSAPLAFVKNTTLSADKPAAAKKEKAEKEKDEKSN